MKYKKLYGKEEFELIPYVKEYLEITSISDIPSKGSGLGSSSAFTCALIKCLCKFLRKKTSNKEIAKIASIIEINKCKSNIGIQDQYASGIGGFNFLIFNKKKRVLVKKINKKHINLKNFFLVSTNTFRSANRILKHQQQNKNLINRNYIISELVKISYDVLNLINNNKKVDYGFYLEKSWELKKKISNKITNVDIEKLYNLGIKSGATGGKLLGAGGGGFILFYVPSKNHKKFLKNFINYKIIKPKIDFEGAKAIKVN